MQSGKLAYIDAVRGCAILLVVLVHQAGAVDHILPLGPIAHQIGQYGHLGVQLFFVASALTLCLSFERRQNEERRLTKFYLRRFFRIAPMYYFAIAIYFVVAKTLTGTIALFTPVNVLANVLFLHGFVPPALNDIVPGGWSIAGEMFFYAWFPFAFLSASWLHERFGLWPIMCFVASVLSLYALAWHIIPILSVYEIERGNVFYYWAPAQVPVFLIGLAGYFAFLRFPPASKSVNSLGFLVLTLATVLMWRSGYVAAFAWVPSLAAISFVFLMRALSLAATLPAWLQAVGRASYSMYILHFLVVWFMAPIIISIVAEIIPSGAAVLAISYPVTAGAAYGLAWVSLRIIEGPGIAAGRQILSSFNSRE